MRNITSHRRETLCIWQRVLVAAESVLASSSSRGYSGGGGGHKVAPAGGPPSHKTLRRTVLHTLNTLAYTCPFVPPWPTPTWPSLPANYLHRNMLICCQLLPVLRRVVNLQPDFWVVSPETLSWNLTWDYVLRLSSIAVKVLAILQGDPISLVILLRPFVYWYCYPKETIYF